MSNSKSSGKEKSSSKDLKEEVFLKLNIAAFWFSRAIFTLVTQGFPIDLVFMKYLPSRVVFCFLATFSDSSDKRQPSHEICCFCTFNKHFDILRKAPLKD